MAEKKQHKPAAKKAKKAKKKAAARLPAKKKEVRTVTLEYSAPSEDFDHNSYMAELDQAIKQRRYDQVERIATEMLDESPSEEADRFIHDIITSAVTIRDAEDEIRYQLDDLRAALQASGTPREQEIDGL